MATPLISLCSLFEGAPVYAKCEFMAPSGCFKIRGANHLLERLAKSTGIRRLVVPSMGNTALGAATAAREFGFSMTGVVPTNISRDKDEKLLALGVDLVKVDGGGSDLLTRATEIAAQTGGYFVHPHLDPDWTDGYAAIAAEILETLPNCANIVIPVGGGGLLLGMLAELEANSSRAKLIGCEPYTFPKYAQYSHARSATIADGLRLEKPHPSVQAAIEANGIRIELVTEEQIQNAMSALYNKHALVVEPSSAITVAWLMQHAVELEGETCAVLTGENIAASDFARLIAQS